MTEKHLECFGTANMSDACCQCKDNEACSEETIQRCKKPEMNEEDYDVDVFDEPETRKCSESCSHYDSLNECCWVASERRLCTDVEEGDYCLYGKKEDEV